MTCGVKWSELEKIHKDYIKNQAFFETTAQTVISKFLTNEAKDAGVHSVRFRLKNPDGLIEKIIRKSIDGQKKETVRNITVNNYKKEITDLIGIRILHAFKNDWLSIHNYILKYCEYKIKENPTTYYRRGDSVEFIEQCKINGCEAVIHPKAYRSIHYIIKPFSGINECYVEIQVRTVFEDGWSEIDHKMRYSAKKGDKNPLDMLLLALNRIAGSADEIGSIIRDRKAELMQKEYENQVHHRGKKK